MKIAVTSQNRREITGHAGKCTRFWIYDATEGSPGEIKGKELLELPKEQLLHGYRGVSHPVLDSVQVLISGGMGEGMRHRLAERNIRGIATLETDPDKAIRAFLNGSLIEGSTHECKCSHDHAHQEVRFSPGIS
uniref:Predicted Fe-Mo cluster-binding protein, NifX family n=1 Tax=Candidatus Kentrum sp. LFY TaxID=2126342 RepID=A0A450U9P7_9GAMM|nr:MAG: Predicted Fe-Mo cluster-binding protein, NifX family [Candidatus Kentron sp. LFY]VFJ90077.1 MAG: Predicted Fe-Mo cluster-binding protein, NifX family [Candidatus Kentron sp. LFY]